MIGSLAAKFIMAISSAMNLVAIAKSSASRSASLSRSTRVAFSHFSTSALSSNTQNNHNHVSSPLSFLSCNPPESSSFALHMANSKRSISGKSKPGGDNKKRRASSTTSTSTLSAQSANRNGNDKSNSKKQATNNNENNSINQNETKNHNKTSSPSKPKSNTGRLRLLPPLQPTNEILSRARRQTYNEIKDDTSIANIRRRAQKRGAQTIDSLCQKLCLPLKNTVQTYRREFRIMHPFEKVVMELTVQSRQKKDGLTLYTLLDDIHEGRKELLQLGKDWISKIKSTETAREAYECTEEAKEVMGQVFLDLIERPWSGVMELQTSLRNVPIVRLDCPAVVLVGAPNVGKSSIVRAISSGTPEVNNYPFTTRGMTLGHVQVFWESDQDVAVGNVAGVSIPSEKQLVQENLMRLGVKTRRMKEKELLEEFSRGGVDDNDDDDEWQEEENNNNYNAEGFGEYDEDDETTDLKIERAIQTPISKKSFPISQLCQIMDSPGLLRRDAGDTRNEMEELTLAAMAHLPTAVMYVMDLSGGAGDRCSSVEDQLILRREVRARFPRRPWIDVVSKADLGIIDGAEERLKDILKAEQMERAQHRGVAVDNAGDEPYYIVLSIKEGMGVDELRQEVMRMLGEVRVVLDAMAAIDERIARPV